MSAARIRLPMSAARIRRPVSSARKPSLLRAALLAMLLGSAAAAPASVSSSAPASLLVFPQISVDAERTLDTYIELTNSGAATQAVRCVYVDGSMAAGTAVDFRIVLKAGQPVAWRAGVGAAALPRDGGAVPPAPATPFSGALRCVATDVDGVPAAGDVLIGIATIERGAPTIDAAAYAATGFAATGASADQPDVLVLGGAQAEYAACPAGLALQPFLDGARVGLGTSLGERETTTRIAIATCSSDPVGGATATVDLRVTNEFGQSMTHRRALREHLVSDLSNLDTAVSSQSIFSAAVAGSPTGNVRIVPVGSGSGVLAIALTSFADPRGGPGPQTAVQPQLLGERTAQADLVALTVPAAPAACPGDCNGDAAVAINELISGVNIALGAAPLSSCTAVDSGGDGVVAINELIAAVNAALLGCPA